MENEQEDATDRASRRKLQCRRKLIGALDRAALEEILGDSVRPWSMAHAELEDVIANNWEQHWEAVEGRIQGLFRKAF